MCAFALSDKPVCGLLVLVECSCSRIRRRIEFFGDILLVNLHQEFCLSTDVALSVAENACMFFG